MLALIYGRNSESILSLAKCFTLMCSWFEINDAVPLSIATGKTYNNKLGNQHFGRSNTAHHAPSIGQKVPDPPQRHIAGCPALIGSATQ